MNAAKETINYYCDDIIKDGYLGQGITAAVDVYKRQTRDTPAP